MDPIGLILVTLVTYLLSYFFCEISFCQDFSVAILRYCMLTSPIVNNVKVPADMRYFELWYVLVSRV